MNRPLRIGVNALYLIPGGVGGTEVYLRSLLHALASIDKHNQYFLFTNRETKDLNPQQPNFQPCPQPIAANFRPARLLWEQSALPTQVRRMKLDVLFNPGFTAPFVCPCPMVTVFHDLQHKRHPEYFRWFDLPAWRFFLYWSASRSQKLIAVSEATRLDLQRFYGLPATRISVVPHGVSRDFFHIGRDPQKMRRAILCVSTLHPHKNLDRLVRAFARIHRQRPEFRLVIAGMHGFETKRIEQTIVECGVGAQVHLTGWIPFEKLLDLYRTSWAFVYPSTFEGFGMPVLEALAAGIPTAVSDIEPMKSIAGDAALRFNPFEESEMEASLLRLVDDDKLRAALAEDGPRRASAFSWETSAELTLKELKLAAGGGRPGIP